MVRRLLEEKGAHVFDADAVAKHLMESDPAVREGLREVLGPDTWQPDGLLNKPWIAARIFGDAGLRSRVNAVVHPAVHQTFDDQCAVSRSEGAPAIVREAALLPKPEQRESLDRLVAVVAPRTLRLQRVLDRDDLTVSDIEERMRAQPDDDHYAAVADDIIRNSGTLDELTGQVDRLWTSWGLSE